MKYIIYGAPGSGSGIVEAACAEIGLEYEVRDLDARNDEHRGEAYEAVNPHRKMPTLETEDGEIITKFSVWLDQVWRQEHLPKIDALTSAVLARPALAEVWARHVR